MVEKNFRAMPTLTSLIFFTFTHLKQSFQRKKIGVRKPGLKSSSSLLDRPPKTKLPWGVSLQVPHLEQSGTRPGISACHCNFREVSFEQTQLPLWMAYLKPGLLEWNIKYHSVDLMVSKSPSWAAREPLVCIPGPRCARKTVTINRCPPSW